MKESSAQGCRAGYIEIVPGTKSNIITLKNFQCFIATLKLNLKQGAPPGHEVTMLLIPLNVENFFALLANITHAIEVKIRC